MTEQIMAGAPAGAPLDARRRRAVYRAAHRGTKEMDVLLGRYADATLAAMDESALTSFEAFLTLPDPDLYRWILEPETLPTAEFAPLVLAIRRFHRIAG